MEQIGPRYGVQYFHLKGLSPTNIKMELQILLWGETAPAFTTVKYWVAEFKLGRTNCQDGHRIFPIFFEKEVRGGSNVILQGIIFTTKIRALGRDCSTTYSAENPFSDRANSRISIYITTSMFLSSFI
ncbi:hypothetical protein NQ318_023190 [Aromia moschata]|uniref:Uncharacterized protein n=1 Tax=Aromia moschata TaxID=1265417 RepID=A0AAV8Y169_9CUCU|nr:hypothetical protein NQ318_023190 [Aromia moschata]